MFLTWSLADAWQWIVHLPFVGGLLLVSPILALLISNWSDERR